MAIKTLKHPVKYFHPPLKRKHDSARLEIKREDKEHRCRIFHFIKPLIPPSSPPPGETFGESGPVKSLLLARVEIPSDRGGSLLSSETRLRARKENVNQTSWVRGKDGVLRVLALLSPPVERGGKRAKGEVSIGYMSVCVCLCVCIRSCGRVFGGERSVDANATLVGGWLFRRPVIYRPSCP